VRCCESYMCIVVLKVFPSSEVLTVVLMKSLSSGTWNRLDCYRDNQHFGGYFCVTFMLVKYYCLRTATLKMQAANISELLVPTCKTAFACPRRVEFSVHMSLLVQCVYHSVSLANTRRTFMLTDIALYCRISRHFLPSNSSISLVVVLCTVREIIQIF
jgi:hypothetical protein